MRKIWAEILKRRRSSFVILISGLLASAFAIVQIAGDVKSIVDPDSTNSSGVAASVEGGAISDLINNSRGLAAECSYQGIWLKNASGARSEIQESRWLTENPAGDTEFKYRCLNMNLEATFIIANLALTNPGTIQISGTVPKGFASNLSISVVSQDKDQSWCGTTTFDFQLQKDADGYVRLEQSKKLAEPYEDRCRFVYPAGFISVQKESNLQESTTLSKKIDSLLVKSTPKNCAYVGATILDSYNLPNGSDKEFAQYINSNYLSPDSFGESSPGADDYAFDPSLGFKLEYFPEWIWVCRGASIEYSEVHLGGYNWSNGVVTKPTKNVYRGLFNPWTKVGVQVTARLEAFNKKLESCGTFTADFSPSTDVDGWQRFNEMLDAGSAFESGQCKIFALKSLQIK